MTPRDVSRGNVPVAGCRRANRCWRSSCAALRLASEIVWCRAQTRSWGRPHTTPCPGPGRRSSTLCPTAHSSVFSHPVLGGTGGNPSMAAVSAAIRSRRNPRTVGSDDRGQAFGVDLALRQGRRSRTFSARIRAEDGLRGCRGSRRHRREDVRLIVTMQLPSR